jgi:hypothetical protein|tara:strand:- start:786 stop:1025 length:240 start_codon:yes stop_codon:yes gene_type:complete
LVERAYEAIRLHRKIGAFERIDAVFGGIADEHPTQAGSGHWSHHDNIGTKRSALFLNDGFGYRRSYRNLKDWAVFTAQS